MPAFKRAACGALRGTERRASCSRPMTIDDVRAGTKSSISVQNQSTMGIRAASFDPHATTHAKQSAVHPTFTQRMTLHPTAQAPSGGALAGLVIGECGNVTGGEMSPEGREVLHR